MDAVREAAGRAGGAVSIRSRRGEGTTVRLVLPLSISLTQILTVGLGGQVFGLPLEAVVETLRLPGDAVLEPREGAEAFALGERVLPLVPLRRVLGLPEREAPEREAGCRTVKVSSTTSVSSASPGWSARQAATESWASARAWARSTSAARTVRTPLVATRARGRPSPSSTIARSPAAGSGAPAEELERMGRAMLRLKVPSPPVMRGQVETVRREGIPLLVVTGGWSPSLEVAADAAASLGGGQRKVIASEHHFPQSISDEFNQTLDAFMRESDARRAR